jgi:hypothetical protein
MGVGAAPAESPPTPARTALPDPILLADAHGEFALTFRDRASWLDS